MTKTKRAIILLVALATLLTFGWAQRAGGNDAEIIKTEVPEAQAALTTAKEEEAKTPEKKEIVEVKTVLQTTTREAWLADLIMCESSGRPHAINEVDRDGTASYGLLQFKPSTFEMFSKAYGIPGELMDPEAQKAIVRRMMDDSSVRWENQFPDCVRKLGRPPQQ